MCKASFLYSTVLSELESVPQPSRLTEKLSLRRTFPVLLATGVGPAEGTLVGGIGLAVSVGRGTGVLVVGFRKGIFRQFAPSMATPATEKSRHAPARQPTIQMVRIPGLEVAGFTGAGLAGG